MPSAAKGEASPWFEVRAQKPADGKVRLLEVSLYAKGPRKGDRCPDVAFHEENASRYTWNNSCVVVKSTGWEFFVPARTHSGKAVNNFSTFCPLTTFGSKKCWRALQLQSWRLTFKRSFSL